MAGGVRCLYSLRGVIYSGESHFTCRVIKPDGESWYHDGIETGRKSESEGSIHSKDPKFLST
ncbi:hypothetical protein B0H10DRAFT_1865246 [Mycena sp. CBHHK59/15]|nr:hypothetical protein B0H10DRAFT_1865246 [Mycena sp. CBHHK59/15]